MALEILDNFRWKFLQDVVLGPSQDEGSDAPFQGFQRVHKLLCFFKLVLHPFYVACQVFVVSAVEGGFVLQKVGHQKVKKRPEFGDSILQGRSAQCQLSLSFELLNVLSDDRFGIFDFVRFVENQVKQVNTLQLRKALAYFLVVYDQNVVVCCMIKNGLPIYTIDYGCFDAGEKVLDL